MADARDEALSFDEFMEELGKDAPEVGVEAVVVDDYTFKAERWYTTKPKSADQDIFDRVPPGEVEPALESIDQRSHDFRVMQPDDEAGKILDEDGEEVTVVHLTEEHGDGYQVTEVDEEDIPEGVVEELSSKIDTFPLRNARFYELRDVYHREHGFKLDELGNRDISEAHKAIRGFKNLLEEEYDGVAWGYTSGWGI